MDKAVKAVRVLFAVGFMAAMVCLRMELSQYREARDEYRRLAECFADNLKREESGGATDRTQEADCSRLSAGCCQETAGMGAVIETAAVAATGAATETVMVAATGAAAGTTTMDTTGTATGTGTEAAAETVTVAATGTSTETAIGAAGDCRPSPAFLSLRNPDYVFWIRIPGTSVDYPVVKERIDGYYLNHTFEEKENPGGCLFVSDSFKSLEMDHTILYGHNMKDGSMFSDLKKYVDREFLDSHPDIFLHDGLEWRQYRIFSCQIREESDTEVYVQSMEKAEWSSYLDEMVRRSLHKTDLRPVETDRIITLSTCYGSRKRMIVQAVLLCYTE